MKNLLAFVLIASISAAYVGHTYTQGIAPVYSDESDYQSLNYLDGTIDVGILYTTNHLRTETDWNADGKENNGWEKSFDSWYEDEVDQLFLQFEIYDVVNVNPFVDANKQTRCLVCMNVDENSELRDGDTGFAVCYDNQVGNVWTWAAGPQYTAQTKDPQFTFMGTVKAVNKGTAVKATKNNGWLSTMTPWNKNSYTFADCPAGN